MAPSYLAFLIGAWTFFPGRAWQWTAAGLFLLGFPLLLATLDALRARTLGIAVLARRILEQAGHALTQWAITLIFLAYNAAEMLHAIGLTLVRLLVTQRRLLEWE